MQAGRTPGQISTQNPDEPKINLRPFTIELASELAGTHCQRSYVLAHEMQHVALYDAASARAAPQLEQEMQVPTRWVTCTQRS